MKRTVRFRVLDGIAVVTLDAGPVNALTQDIRAALWQVFDRIDANPDIKAAVLTAAGDMFSAGGDLSELDMPQPERPSLAMLCNRIEACPKPVVVAAHGQALGGGAELMLAGHYRLAAPRTRIGLPDVALGLVPGGGGTQRLPRLIGAEPALQMLVSTSAIDADVGHRIGLIDGLVQGELASGAITFAQTLVQGGKGPRPTRADRSRMADGRAYAKAVAKAREAIAGNPLHAPHRVVDCVEAAALLPFEAGLAFEADAYDRCLAHAQSVALRHVFIAERQIDNALIEREGGAFKPVEPMGKAAVLRLRKALRGAADWCVANGSPEAEVDGAMLAYGFRKGPFGGKDGAAENPAIQLRLLTALVAEGAECVEQGAVQRPADIDALAVHGLGFPRRKGGPFRAAQTQGLIGIRAAMRDFAEDDPMWQPTGVLDEAIKDARGFDALG